jgi:ABC-type transport system involved in multi-copper enzyme maturation permease subunit
MSVLTVARWTLKEASRRRLLVGGAVISVAFVVLFALGFAFLYGKAEATPDESGLFVVFAAVVQTILGLYAVQFMTAFLALFLGIGSISPDVDSGVLHAVLARPISRPAYLAGRWLAYAGLLAVYVVVMASSLLLIAHLVAGYGPVDPVRSVALLVLEAVLLLTVGMLGSTFLPTLANGVIVFSMFGLAWLAGVIEFIGDAVANPAMRNLGVTVSLVFPSDAVWRGASYYAETPLFVAEAATQGGLPFAAQTPPAGPMVVWALAYPLVFLGFAFLAFRRRDL